MTEHKKLCNHFIRGSCKFGSSCMNIHPSKLNGFLLVKINDQLLLGYSKTKNCFDIFGGKSEDYDVSPYHTAIREFIEEFFNFKPTIELVGKIVSESKILSINGFYNEKSKAMIFKINDYIFSNIINTLKKYSEIEELSYLCNIKSNLSVCTERPQPSLDPNDGLYSIEYVKLINFEELESIKLRSFASHIIHKLH